MTRNEFDGRVAAMVAKIIRKSEKPFVFSAITSGKNPAFGCFKFNDEETFFRLIAPLFQMAEKKFGKTRGTFALDFFNFVSKNINEERKDD